MLTNERGFTMIELLLVLLGAVLFASIGLSTQKAVGQMQLSMAARSIQTLIRQTQDKAYGEQNTHSIIFDTMTNECVQIKKNRIIKEIPMPPGITLELTSFPKGKLYFTGKLTPSSGGTIFLHSKSHKVEMTVLPVTGRVRIYPITRK